MVLFENCNNTFEYPKTAYRFNKASTKIELDRELVEISGLAYQDDKLIAIQDEDGIIFFIDPEQRKVIQKVNFQGEGDFEGVAFKNDTAYIIESNGKILRISELTDGNPKVEKFKLPIKRPLDAEGLCFQIEEEKLLVVLKNTGNVYRFSLKNEIADVELFLEIGNEEVKSYLEERGTPGLAIEISEAITSSESIFQPSGIAQHPVSKDYYILSAENKLIAVYSKEKELRWIYPFSDEDMMKPEGISFNPKGDLFVSNEGGRKNANILKYNHEKK